MAFARLVPSCGIIFMFMFTLGGASLSDEDKMDNANQDYAILKETVKELNEALKIQSSRFMQLEERLTKSEKKIDLLLLERKRNMNIISRLVQHSGLKTSPTGIKPSKYNTHEVMKHENLEIVRTERLLIPPASPSVPEEKSVAFYAYMSNSLQSPGSHQILKFDDVKTNIGQGYHNNTGVFIAPTSGVYVFSWSIRMNGAVHSVEFIVNNEVHGSLYTDASNMDGHSSGTSIVRVKAGDDVYLRIKTGACNSRGAIFSDSCGRTSFAGWKIFSL